MTCALETCFMFTGHLGLDQEPAAMGKANVTDHAGRDREMSLSKISTTRWCHQRCRPW